MAGKSGQPHPGEAPPPGVSPSRAPLGSERRRHARQDVINQQLVAVNLGDENGGLLLDLSAAGAAVQAVAPLRPTAPSPFAFRLPELHSPIEGTGVFVWVDDSRLAGGLRFDGLSPHSQQLLEQWLRRREPGTAPAQAEAGRAPAAARVEAGAPKVSSAPAPPATTPLGRRDPAVAAKLKRVAERARILTGANGASIALKAEDGTFPCEASVGTALEVGIPLDLVRGLSAECVARKGLVRCDDAQNDLRVDPSMRQQLNLGSALLLPLFAGNVLTGVLGVFSDRPQAFGHGEIRRLHDLAQVVEAGVLKEARGEKPAPPPAPAISSRPVPRAAVVSSPHSRRRAKRTVSLLRVFLAVVLGCALLLAGWVLIGRYFAPSVPRPAPAPGASPPSGAPAGSR